MPDSVAPPLGWFTGIICLQYKGKIIQMPCNVLKKPTKICEYHANSEWSGRAIFIQLYEKLKKKLVVSF